ncbi:MULTISPECIES: hypothetical protein [Actinoplanes]|uniref:hypothetical protein n=1 Tax=Actinoplanes TaxID=1865 RepID=UPI0005F2CD86|nr:MULTISPECIES: hypothetical protein [Actinoplanes]
MHDEVIGSLDECIAALARLRAELAASRPVHPGERRATVLAAIAVAERFAVHAAHTLEGRRPVVLEAHP